MSIETNSARDLAEGRLAGIADHLPESIIIAGAAKGHDIIRMSKSVQSL
jgi:hypothetical protein